MAPVEPKAILLKLLSCRLQPNNVEMNRICSRAKIVQMGEVTANILVLASEKR